MASLLKLSINSIIKSRASCTTNIVRGFAFRKLEIDPHADNKQHSDAQWRLSQVPPVEVSEPVIICDGGCGPLGHPMQYIRMNGPNGGVNRCQYCGQRYVYKPKH